MAVLAIISTDQGCQIGLFANQKSQFGFILESLGMKNVIV
jgi:hypothetical protein